MKKSLLIFGITATIFFNSCSLIHLICYEATALSSGFDRKTVVDTGIVFGKEYYYAGPIIFEFPVYEYPDRWHHDIYFVLEKKDSCFITSNKEWDLLHNDKAYVSWHGLIPDAIEVCEDSLGYFREDQPSWLISGVADKALLFYIRADFYENNLSVYTDSPIHVYKKGMRGEYYKVVFPITDDLYDKLLNINCKHCDSDTIEAIKDWNRYLLHHRTKK